MLKLKHSLFIGKLLLIGGVIVAVGFVGWKRRTPTHELTLYGNVDIRQADLSFPVGGKIAKMLVEEGVEVTPGTLVAVLDTAPYEAKLAEAKALLDQAEANYALHLQGHRSQDIEQARAAVSERKSAVEHAHLLFNRQKEHLKIQTTSQETYEGAFAAKEQAESLLKQAEHALSLLEEGFRQEEIASAKAAVDKAKADLTLAGLYLKDTQLLAPSRGIIMVKAGEVGEVVSPQSVVYTLSLHTPVYIRAYVGESELGYIKPGMEVELTTDTYPNHPLGGTIGFISPQAEFTPKTVETPSTRTDLVYRIRVITEDPERILRQGMPVTLKIKIPH